MWRKSNQMNLGKITCNVYSRWAAAGKQGRWQTASSSKPHPSFGGSESCKVLHNWEYTAHVVIRKRAQPCYSVSGDSQLSACIAQFLHVCLTQLCSARYLCQRAFSPHCIGQTYCIINTIINPISKDLRSCLKTKITPVIPQCSFPVCTRMQWDQDAAQRSVSSTEEMEQDDCR